MSRRRDVDFHSVEAFIPDKKRKKGGRSSPRRQQVNLELDVVVVELLRQIADAFELSPAAACNRLLADALERFGQGEIGFEGYLEPSRSPRYKWVVEVNLNGARQAVEKRLREQG